MSFESIERERRERRNAKKRQRYKRKRESMGLPYSPRNRVPPPEDPALRYLYEKARKKDRQKRWMEKKVRKLAARIYKHALEEMERGDINESE